MNDVLTIVALRGITALTQSIRSDRATALKTEIGRLQYVLKDLKQEWLNRAAYEYAADRFLAEHPDPMNQWTKPEQLAEKMQSSNPVVCPILKKEYQDEFYRHVEWFRKITNLEKVGWI